MPWPEKARGAAQKSNQPACYTCGVGLFEVEIQIANLSEPQKRAMVKLLADTGAAYSMIPRRALDQIGVLPAERGIFEMADGRQIARDVADVFFFWNGKKAPSRVIFGEEGDSGILGAHALEGLALQVDSYNKRLEPAKLRLYRALFSAACVTEGFSS